MSKLKQLWFFNQEVLNFAFRTRLLFFVLIPIAFVITFIDYLGGDLHLNTLISIWTNLIDPIIGITTLIIAFSVWYGELIQDWKNTIPKKLTVIFLYHGKEILRCNRADLASEADIRPLGQQIGSQMVSGGQLKFIAPLVKQRAGNVSFNNDIGFFRDYEVTFELLEPAL